MASVSTGVFNDLFFVYMVIALLVGGAVIGWLFYTMWRYRARPGQPLPADAPRAGVIPAERGHVLWSYVMAGAIAAIMFGLAFSTISAVDTLEKPPADREASHHDVWGFQFGWRFNYTGVGGVPISIVNSFTVPEDTPIILNVTSQDVWHNFAIPDYRIRVDAIPGQINKMWFEATEPAETHSVCVVICGSNHAGMRASLSVLTTDAYATWLAKESEKAYDKHKGALVNATWSGTWTGVEGAAKAEAPLVVNVTNAGESTLRVELRAADGEVLSWRDVAPGASGRLYAVVPDGGIRVATGNAQQILEVS